jgi:hypothetical protein
LDRTGEILLPQQRFGADQHRPGQKHTSTTCGEPTFERCSGATAGLSAQLVVDAERTTCLANQWAVVGEPGRVALLSKPTQSAKQIAEAQYDPANELLHVVFRDGTTEEVNLR